MTYYYRADLSDYIDASYPKIARITSAEELKDYYERNKETYQFHQGYYSEASMADDVFGNESRFNDKFFEQRFLLFIVLEEGSGSVRHRVEPAQPENGPLSVKITRIIPEIGTADMAQWHIVVALEKTLSEMDVDIVLSEEPYA
jgi:hypothetical protein